MKYDDSIIEEMNNALDGVSDILNEFKSKTGLNLYLGVYYVNAPLPGGKQKKLYSQIECWTDSGFELKVKYL